MGCLWHQLAAIPGLPRYSAFPSSLAVGQCLPKDKDTLCCWVYSAGIAGSGVCGDPGL